MSRITWFFLSIVAALPMAAQDPDPPFVEYSQRDATYLRRLHRNPTAKLHFTEHYRGGFKAWQKDARNRLSDLLGLPQIKKDAARHRCSVELAPPIQEDGYQRTLGRIETEPGIFIPFWILVPDGPSDPLRPLAICAQGHGGNSWNTYAGVFSNNEERSKTHAKNGSPAIEAVKRGFITIAPAVRGLADAASIADPKGRHGNRPCRAQLIHCLLAGRTAIGERVWDCQRILDWALQQVAGVDKNRVLFTGNSGGGVLTVYMAALDPRITVAVPSCSFTSYTSAEGFIFHCDCCLVPKAQIELGDFADIGGLAAPTFLLAVHGRQDGLHHFPDVEKAMARVKQIYKAAQAGDNFAHRWGDKGHQFYPELMWPFIEAAIQQ
ncbi:MAG: alpha/beta hydrolase family protein [Planctomycetota bacterium]|nr:alpha/beta hydrolase family protein [Planctomycetota bacterium]